jgi:predicted nucleic acid-binding protein
MIFLDTSAVYALADRGDDNHEPAKRRFDALLTEGHRLLTHSYVLVESMALLQHRLGRPAALAFARETGGFEVEWVGERLHAAAVEHLAARRGSGVSLVDQVSFLVMRARGVDEAFAFDRHFQREGFTIYASH